VVASATGDYHVLALRKDGSLVAWGFNDAGQCDIPEITGKVLSISARGSHSMILINDSAKNRRAFKRR
jgi:alpha-tubulin suppressor-like RCC1 family protein